MCIAFGRPQQHTICSFADSGDADANGYIFGNRLHCPKFVQRHNKSQWLCLIISPNARWGESLQAAGRLAGSGHRATGKLSCFFSGYFLRVVAGQLWSALRVLRGRFNRPTKSAGAVSHGNKFSSRDYSTSDYVIPIDLAAGGARARLAMCWFDISRNTEGRHSR